MIWQSSVAVLGGAPDGDGNDNRSPRAPVLQTRRLNPADRYAEAAATGLPDPIDFDVGYRKLDLGAVLGGRRIADQPAAHFDGGLAQSGFARHRSLGLPIEPPHQRGTRGIPGHRHRTKRGRADHSDGNQDPRGSTHAAHAGHPRKPYGAGDEAREQAPGGLRQLESTRRSSGDERGKTQGERHAAADCKPRRVRNQPGSGRRGRPIRRYCAEKTSGVRQILR